MKSLRYIFCIIIAFATSHCVAMRRISKWPPLLWCTHQHPGSLVKELQQHNISVADYLKSQVEDAQKKALDAVQKEWLLPEEDIKRTHEITKLVQSYDKKLFKNCLLAKVSPQHKEFECVYDLVHEVMDSCDVPVPFTVQIHPEGAFDTMVLRNLDNYVCTHKGKLTLGTPESGKLPMPSLALGAVFFALSEQQQLGLLAHTIGGKIKHEHTTHKSLIKRLITEKGTMPTRPLHSYETVFRTANILAADILPTTDDSQTAQEVLSWLLATKSLIVGKHSLLEARIKNMEAVCNLYGMEKKLATRH